jgi:hypothetical protein
MRWLALVAVPLALAGCLQGLVGGGGVSAADYASSKTYRTWVIEVDHSSGAAPDSGLLDFVKGRLNSVVQKDSITFQDGETLSTDPNHAWTDAEVQSFADQHRSIRTQGSQVATHLLFLTGHSADDSGNSRVLGITYGHELIAIFSDSVKVSCANVLPLFPCDPAPYFRAVLVHEFGHAIGLVNNGAPMQQNHEAATCNNKPDQHHSANQGSVMFCQVETSLAFGLFGSGGPPTDFDDNDRADVRALW